MPEITTAPSPLASSLAILDYTGRVYRQNTLKQTVVFFFRSFWQFGLSSRWFTFIEAFSHRHGLGTPPLELVRKAFGAYFTLGLPLAAREALLEDHYRIAADHVPVALLRDLWTGTDIRLGTVDGKKDSYHVWLRRSDQCGTRHEGEWTAGFESAGTGEILCRITFLLARGRDGVPTVVIGGLQGPGREVGKKALVTATRDLGGLRPKDAMLLVAAGLARALGAQEMLAIDNDSHPINYRAKRRRQRMLTDYDDYWRERGGEAGGPFGFILPAKDPAEAEAGNRRRDEAKSAFFACGQRMATGLGLSSEAPAGG